MKSKIVCLSKNDEFKEILKGKKKSNKYFTIFFKKLYNKDKKKLNSSIYWNMYFKTLNQFKFDQNTHSHKFYRLINEIPTILLILIVFVVIFKPL